MKTSPRCGWEREGGESEKGMEYVTCAGMHLLPACSGSSRLCERVGFDTASEDRSVGMLFSPCVKILL